MAKPFKFRYVNEIAGGFVLAVIILLVIGIFVAGHAQGWFERHTLLTLNFPPEGSLDLQKGAEVVILGTRVGSIEDIKVKTDGSMNGQVLIKGHFIRFVRADSRAIVKKKFGLAGDAYLEITKGSGVQLGNGGVLTAVKDTEITEMIQDAVKQVREVTLPAIEQARKAIEEYTHLAADLRNPEGHLQKLIANLDEVSASIAKGEGTVGQLTKDPALANELRSITGKINDSLAEVKKILSDVHVTTGVLRNESQDLSGTVLQTRETMAETEKLIVGIQNHWLIRGYIEQDSRPSAQIPPSAVGGGTP